MDLKRAQNRIGTKSVQSALGRKKEARRNASSFLRPSLPSSLLPSTSPFSVQHPVRDSRKVPSWPDMADPVVEKEPRWEECKGTAMVVD